MVRRRAVVLGFLVLLAAVAVPAVGQGPRLPAPETFLGFRVGSDRRLATWDQVARYVRLAAETSDRVRYEELGKSTMGHPFPLLVLSSPRNLARLPQIRADQRRLAYPYELEPAEAAEIIARNPAVVLVTLTIHSTEVGSTQMSLELVHRLATEQSRYVENLLENVVFLLVPSLNPDGQVLVADWYHRNVGTEFEYAPLPWLYHKYTGHDNNRDAYMLTQVESRLLTRVLYKDWFPVVYLDEHQMGSSGARIFVPPFADPINPNQDPLVIAGSNLMGMYLFTALNAAGFEGVQYGERFTWWWQGSFKNGGWYHNMIGLLSEVASARLASPIEQRRAELFGTTRGGAPADPRQPLPPPADTWPRTNYPRPWLGGTWTLRNIVDYELVLTYALLEAAAAHREMLQKNFYNLNRKAIEVGRQGNPFAYILPAEQHDPGAAAHLLDLLEQAGVEIRRAREPFQADGKEYPAGSHVVLMAQPFRNYAKDLLEPQRYPMRPAAPGQSPERPYDVTGWTLPLQMGVTAVEARRPFAAALEPVGPVPPPEGRLSGPSGPAATYLLPHAWNAGATAVNRLLAEQAGGKPRWEVSWAAEGFRAGGREHPVGTILVRHRAAEGDPARALEKLARATHVPITAVADPVAVPAWKLRAPRIGLYQPWTANMDEGWTRWVLERYEFPYVTVRNADLQAGKLGQRFDVLLFASQSKTGILEGNRGAWHRPEHRGGVGPEGVRALDEFVRAGGSLVTLDAAADFALDALGLPVRNALRGLPADQFYCPGAILETYVDNRHPLGYGMPSRASAYFLNSPAFELIAPFTTSRGRAVARYPATNPLQSGWIGGPEHLADRLGVVEVSHGRGRVVLLGFRAQFRAQPHGTFKLLFNALHWSAAERTAPRADAAGSGDARGRGKNAPRAVPRRVGFRIPGAGIARPPAATSGGSPAARGRRSAGRSGGRGPG